MLLFHNRQLQESLLHVIVLQLVDIKMQAAQARTQVEESNPITGCCILDLDDLSIGAVSHLPKEERSHPHS